MPGTILERVSKQSSERGLVSPQAANTFFTSADKRLVETGGNLTSLFGTQRPIQSAIENANINLLFDLIKESPEFVGVVRARIQDIMADGYELVGKRRNVAMAEQFLEDSEFYRKLSSGLWDWHVAGDSFMLKLGAAPEAVDTFLNQRIGNGNFTKDFDSYSFKRFIMDRLKQGKLTINKAPLTRTRDLQLLDTRSIWGDIDETGIIIQWNQRVNFRNKSFRPEDVIHISTDNIGGNPYGFTPAHTLLKDIITLTLAKDYASKVFENDSVPLGMFNFPRASPDNDRDHAFLVDQLREIRKSKNKLRTIVTTGEVNYTALNNLAKDFEFRQLIQHFTTIVMFAWGVPSHRVPFLAENIRPQPKEANEGYFKSIAHDQKILEAQLNRQLWSEFGVRMVFNKGYRIDELREANIAAIVADRGLATTNEIRSKWLAMEPRADGDSLPSTQQNQVFTSFDENRDDRMSRGDDSDMMEEQEDMNHQLKRYQK